MQKISGLLKLVIMLAVLAGCSESQERTRKIIPIKTTDDVLTNLKPIGEAFEIDSNRDTLLKGESGTLIYFPTNAFQFSDGTKPQGKVSVELKECYTLSEIISEGLSTTSGSQLLQTAGMIYLKATSDRKSVV